MEKMLVTQILKELTTLEARTQKKIRESEFIAAAKKSDDKIKPGVTKEKFMVDAKANMDSCKDLIARANHLREVLVASNAITMVTVAGKEMTVAAAIQRKQNIDLEYELIQTMSLQYNKAQAAVLSKNANMETQIDRLVEVSYGKDSKNTIKPEDYESIATPYRNSNEFDLVDPLHLKDLIDSMQKELDDFMAEVDSALQISNCTTVVEV